MAECPFAPRASPPGNAPSSVALEATDPLQVLNEAFRDAYAERRDALLAGMGPVIAQIDDVLILRNGEQRLEGPARTRRYHELKAINHLPLALYVLLMDRRGALDGRTRERLTSLRGLITAAEDSLARRGFTPEQLTRQRRLLEGSLGLVERVLAEDRIEPATLWAFTRSHLPELMGNIEDAARDQLETMHATVEAWKKRMTPEERARLRAVVAVAHMSRPGNVAMQYFSVTLGDTWEGHFDQEDLQPGKRVLASETGFDEAGAFTLLATQALDASVGEHFFGEEMRLERDVLADAAERILADMFHQEPEPPPPPGQQEAAQ
ncbi:hypothetical protein [Melittangium boletus]|uniref:Uncharacterized protein n=1 Tax=Melittangium boletus DSM 14713 TaxID=1294270 RepID=A0A250IDQ8_9BACT|nr:hypothetical protein [Melittangium boletus]ATB29979.1 hypothetical protein MEBOL_003434 [Melittangium boletus DSM 14713]